MPAFPDKPWGYIWASQDIGSFVKALEKQPAGTSLLGISEEMTPAEWLRMWGQYNSVQTRYVQCSSQELEDQMGGMGLGIQIAEAMLFFGEFGYGDGNGKNKTPGDVSRLLPHSFNMSVVIVARVLHLLTNVDGIFSWVSKRRVSRTGYHLSIGRIQRSIKVSCKLKS